MTYERILRKMRQRIFDYPESKQAKAARVLERVKAKAMAQRPPERIDPLTGMTFSDRRALWRNGICVTD